MMLCVPLASSMYGLVAMHFSRSLEKIRRDSSVIISLGFLLLPLGHVFYVWNAMSPQGRIFLVLFCALVGTNVFMVLRNAGRVGTNSESNLQGALYSALKRANYR